MDESFKKVNRGNKIKEFTSKTWVHVVLIVFFSFTVLFWNLSKGSLVDWDEANYACVSRELLVKGDFLATSETDCMTSWSYFWFEKPPLFFLLQAQVYRFLGVSTFSSRMLGALFGVGCILLVFLIGTLLFDKKTGLFASIVLLTSPQFVRSSRQIMLDVPVTFFILLSIYFFFKGREKRFFLIFAGISCSLAVLTKFAIGIFALFLFLLIFLMEPKSYLKHRGFLALMIVFFLLIALPWHTLQYNMNGWKFIENYFFKQSIGRLNEFENHNYGRLFFFKVLFKGFSPWIYFFPVACLALIFVEEKYRELGVFVLWFVILFTVFSIAKNQLPWYMIYVYPALAIIVGRFFSLLDGRLKGLCVLFFLVFFFLVFDLPYVSDCNFTYNAVSDAAREYRILLHDSLPKTPGRVFYIGNELNSSESILEYEKRHGFFIAVFDVNELIKDQRLNDSNKIFEEGEIVVSARGLNETQLIELKRKFKRDSLPRELCYPYMPVNL